MAATPTASAGVTEDPWLARVLRKPVFVVAGEPPVEAAPGFYYAKVDVADVRRVRALCEGGFAPVDVAVSLTRPPGRDAGTGIRGTEVRPAAESEYDALVAIGGSCFRYSRFHLDPAIPNDDADRVKSEWVRSYVEGTRGVELLAALDRGRPVGFLCVLDTPGGCVIDLVGVERAAQGRGVGSALVASFIVRHGAHARDLRVGTQLANTPSLRLYEKHGFRVASGAYVLHRHV